MSNLGKICPCISLNLPKQPHGNSHFSISSSLLCKLLLVYNLICYTNITIIISVVFFIGNYGLKSIALLSIEGQTMYIEQTQASPVSVYVSGLLKISLIHKVNKILNFFLNIVYSRWPNIIFCHLLISFSLFFS